MIASSGRPSFPHIVSRRFEFSRFQDQVLASAYEALIPTASVSRKGLPARASDFQRDKTRIEDPQLSA
jgi:hypothetical protein